MFCAKKMSPFTKETISQVALNICFYFVFVCGISELPLIPELLLKVLCSSDMGGHLCHIPSPLAISPSPAACQGFKLLLPCLAFFPPASLCLFIIPSLHQWLFHRSSGVGFVTDSELFLRNVAEQPFYLR
ncbi:hypothetical protein ILYODFUR_000628, partial [Ilyodon furcidens]